MANIISFKKAQISFYIMLAVIIVVILGVYLALSSTNSVDQPAEIEKQVSGQLDVSSMIEFGQQCLASTATEGVVENAMRGGFYHLTDDYFTTEYSKVPYYFINNKNIMPTLDVLERELASYIDDNLHLCVRKFKTFRDMGYTIDAKKPTSSVAIAPDKIQVTTTYPITVTNPEGLTAKIYNFQTTLRIPYGKTFATSQEIINAVVADPYYIHHSHNAELMIKTGFQIDTISYGTKTVYVIRDSEKLENNLQLIYLFVTQPSKDNQKPKLMIEKDDFEINAGETFNLIVNAVDPEGTIVTYGDDTDLFDIGEYSGVIEFTPTVDEIGTYFISISASDEFDTVKKEITIRVK